MSRQEKKTRMRMLPPRVQLQQRDALTGSYPTTVRFSTDGRTGKYPINFDDTGTINFQDYVSGTINLNDLQQYVIHYQRWNEEEFIEDDGTSILFKQTYVGTPYDSGEDAIIKNINNTGTPGSNNWFKGANYIWPTNTALHPKLSSIYISGAINRIDNIFDYTNVDPNLNFTISMWINTENIPLELPLVRLSRTNNNVAGRQSWYLALVFGQLTLVLIDATGNINAGPYALAYSSNPANSILNFENKWVHVAATYSGGGSAGIKLYVNGLPVTATTADSGIYTNMNSTAVSLIFGSSGGGSPKFYTGYLAEFTYIGAALTDQQINDIYQINILGREVYGKIDLGYAPAIGLTNTNNWLLQSDASDVEEIIYSTIVAPTGSINSGIIDNLPFIHFSPGQEITPFRDSDQPAVDGKSSGNSFYATGSAVADIGEGFTSPLWSKNKIEIDIGVAAPCSATLFLSGAYWGSLAAPPVSTYNKSYEMLYYNFDKKTWQGIGKGIPYGFSHNGTPNVGSVPFENDAMFAFAPSIVNLLGVNNNNFRTQVTGVFEWQAAGGQPFTNLGFPYHPKYHATGSQTLNMSQYINEPFLVEKIVVELSAAYTIFATTYNTASYLYTAATITSITQSTVPASINNIFILNQRRPINYSYSERMEYSDYPSTDCLITASLPINYQLASGNETTYVDTIRDIITWGGVSSFAANILTSSFRSGIGGQGTNQVIYGGTGTIILPQTENPKELMTRECVFTSSVQAHDDLTPLSWNGRVYMELPAKSPIRIDRNPELNSANPPDNMSSFFEIRGPSGRGIMDLKYSGGGRNALGILVPNGRNYISPVAQIQNNGNFKNSFSLNKENILVTNENRYRYNPYILLPTDNLIIGWQQPLMNFVIGATNSSVTVRNSISGSFSEIKFLPGNAKITLYGSYIREGREYNDGTNQLLSSDSVHEVIE